MDSRHAGRRALVSRFLIIEGALLVVVAAIHLAMTAELGSIVARFMTPKAFAFVWPPYALDHVVVGILLFPIGLTTIICAAGVRDCDVRMWWIALVNALAILSMPIALALMIDVKYFLEAPAFLIAAIVISLVGLSMLWPLLWIGRSGRAP
jgi:hypothetical protein